MKTKLLITVLAVFMAIGAYAGALDGDYHLVPKELPRAFNWRVITAHIAVSKNENIWIMKNGDIFISKDGKNYGIAPDGP